MEKNREFLNNIYQNADMGRSSIEEILPKVEDPHLVTELESEVIRYKQLASSASSMLRLRAGKPKKQPPLKKASAKMGIVFNTLMDRSDSKIAQIMINGTTMGIIDINKNLSSNAGYDDTVRSLGEETLRFEQHNVEKLKEFL